MTRRARLQLQPVEADAPPDTDDPLDRITDSVARELFELKVELGIGWETFTAVPADTDE